MLRVFILSVFLAFGCAAGGASKVLLCSDASVAQGNSAILNGMRDAAADIAKLSNTAFDIELLAVSTQAEAMAALAKAYLGGYYGAAVYPPRDAGAEFAAKLAELKKAGFAVAVLGRRFETSDAVCRVFTDTAAARDMLAGVIARRGAGAKAACYFYAKRRARLSADNPEVSEYLPEALAKPDFDALFNGKILDAEAFEFYSSYADENKIEILRRDAFGEVFFSPMLLANMAPIAPDADRKYAVCVGSLPMLAHYLLTAQITDCVYDDFFGWGLHAMRALREAKTGGAPAAARAIKVRPVHASMENCALFLSDWRKWLK